MTYVCPSPSRGFLYSIELSSPEDPISEFTDRAMELIHPIFEVSHLLSDELLGIKILNLTDPLVVVSGQRHAVNIRLYDDKSFR